MHCAPSVVFLRQQSIYSQAALDAARQNEDGKDKEIATLHSEVEVIAFDLSEVNLLDIQELLFIFTSLYSEPKRQC